MISFFFVLYCSYRLWCNYILIYRLLTASVPLAQCDVKINLYFLMLLLRVEKSEVFAPDSQCALWHFSASMRVNLGSNDQKPGFVYFLWPHFLLKMTNAHTKVYFSLVHFSGLCLKKATEKNQISTINRICQVRSEHLCEFSLSIIQWQKTLAHCDMFYVHT